MIPETQTQQSLFKPAHDTAKTSIQALATVQPMRSQRQAAIETAIGEANDGQTREELSIGMCIRLSSICGLVRQMVKYGWLIENGDTRPTQSGCNAKILRLGANR